MATINSGNSTTLYSTTQTTTSVTTPTTLPAPRVNETNFTTLYSNPTAAAQGGGTSGNLLVSGNLRVLGTSDLEGAVTISNSYILPTSDGTANQVVTTDGSGNLTFQNVTSLSNYSIQADTTTGGANLTLVGTSTTDSVKFASGTNITVSRTDANTITISTVADNIPDGTARGQLLYWDGSAWTANSEISASAAANRLTAIYENSTAGTSSALRLRKNYGATNYSSANDDGVSLNFGLTSNSQGTNTYGLVSFEYSATDPQFVVVSSTDNFATVTDSLLVLDKDSADFYAPSLTINTNSQAVDSYLYMKGTSASIKFDNAEDRFELNKDLLAPGLQGGNVQIAMTGSSDNEIYIGGNDLQINTDGSHVIQSNSPIQTTAQSISINSDSTADDSYLYMKGTSRSLKWEDANNQFILNADVFGSGAIIALNYLATNSNQIYFNLDDVSAADSYLSVKRGASPDVSIKWNEATTKWQFTNDGTTYYDMAVNIDDLNDVVITPPVASGQFLVQDGTNWVNSSTVIATTAGDRPRFQYNDSTAGYDSAILLRKNFGATAYTTGDGTGLGITIDSDSQPAQQLASIGAVYDATAPIVFLSTNANPNTTGPFITAASFSSAAATLAGSSLTLDSDNTGAAADSYIYANRGSSGADAFLQWSESNSWWGSSGSLFAAANVIATGDLATNSTNIWFNYDDDVANDCFLQVKRAASPDVNIKWNEATDRWQTTVDGTNYLNIPNQNLDTDSNVTFASVTVDGGHTVIDTTTTTTTTTSATAITSTSNATTRSSKFQIQVTDNVTGNIHVLEALIFFQGTTAYLTTYAEMYNSTSLATFTADVDSGNTRLLATAASTNNTTFKVTRISVAL